MVFDEETIGFPTTNQWFLNDKPLVSQWVMTETMVRLQWSVSMVPMKTRRDSNGISTRKLLNCYPDFTSRLNT